MKWLAQYICQKSRDTYFRTIWADTLSEASKQADRYAKKGYIMLKVVQNV